MPRNLPWMDDATLARFADLVVGFGANVQTDQIVSIGCEPGKEYLVRALAASAYRHGAKFVDVGWFDPHVKRARIEHARPDTLDFVPPWYGERVLALGEQRGARVALSGPSAPGLLADLDPALVGKDRLPAVKEGIQVVNDRTTNWTICPCPTPGLGGARLPRPRRRASALERLEHELLHVLRLDEEDPIAAWRARADTLVGTAERISERRFDALHYEGPGHRPDDRPAALLGLARRALPDRRRDRAHAQPPDRGGLHHARSRAHAGHGDLDEAARADRRHRRARPRRPLRGRAGRRPGGLGGRRDAETIIGTDDGAARLGEVALVDREGRIGELGTIFYDTLLDENAASHIALGQGFPFVLDEEDRERCNESEIHIDFMIGSNELTVTGLTREGDRVPLLSEGRWQV